MPVTLVWRIEPWLSALALMGVIFFLSAQPDLDSGLGVIDLIGRKVLHALEYGLLCFLWWRALRSSAGPARAAALSFIVSVAYAVSDEYHQTVVEGREGTPIDVAIDAAGAGAVALLIRRRA